MMKQIVPLQPAEDCAGADTHAAAHGRPHTTADVLELQSVGLTQVGAVPEGLHPV